MKAYRIVRQIVIESKVDLPDARWCFYMVAASPNDAKRIVGVLNSENNGQQMELVTA